ncbi:hypothetical protein B0H19DRAFT_1368181 [Mycena capillaripes]|nr:hypothetical protein B0H19DRAFT_1368181 [Mycena capillaripes]
MRAIPQPPMSLVLKVAQLSDSIQDLGHLLRALYNPLFDSAERLGFPVVAAIVRLGKKHGFYHLLAAAVARLTAAFPRSLGAEGQKHYSIRNTRMRQDKGLLFDAIDLANDTSLLALLPSLYFDTLLHLDANRDLLTRRFFIPVYTLTPMRTWDEMFGIQDLCTECCRSSKTRYDAGPRKFWDNLPHFFNLPGWDDLNSEV